MLKIATLVYNTPDLAKKMVKQIPSVIVIDNGSYPPIEGAQIRFEKNHHWAGGWNRVLDILDADYVWMLNSDIEYVDEQMGEELLEYAVRIQNLAVISPAYDSCHPHMWAKPFCKVRETNWVDWAAGMLSMSAWRSVGKFDEELLPGYGSDMDWNWRAKIKKFRFAIVDGLEFHHTTSYTVYKENMFEKWNAYNFDAILKKKWGKDLDGNVSAPAPRTTYPPL